MLTTALEVRIAEVLGSDVRDARLTAKGMLAVNLQNVTLILALTSIYYIDELTVVSPLCEVSSLAPA